MLTSGKFTIQSTLDGVMNLTSKYTYDTSLSSLPVVIMVHGFNLSIDAITQDIMTRIAEQGFFVVAVGMRGRKQNGGKPDASGKELHDIYDCVQYIKKQFDASDKVTISGYSGGGGNVLGALSKFPELFNMGINHFGMGDYGYNTTSWYNTNPDYRTDIARFIGTTPSINRNEYYSRNHIDSITNFKGQLLTYHDREDDNVSIVLSELLQQTLRGKNMNAQFYYSNTSDSIRYLHSMSVSEKTEPTWLPLSKQLDRVKLSNVGTLQVHGYVITDLFSIKLGNLTNHVAEVDYNTQKNTFTIKPKTGRQYVSIRKGDLVFGGYITNETTVTLQPTDNVVNGMIKKMYIKHNGIFHEVKKAVFNDNQTIKQLLVKGDHLI